LQDGEYSDEEKKVLYEMIKDATESSNRIVECFKEG